MFLYLLLFCSVLYIVLFRYRRRQMYKLASQTQSLSDDLPFVGIAHLFTGSTEEIMNTLQKFSYEAMEHNGLVHGWLGNILYFALNPVDVEAVLKMCLEKDDLHRFLRKVIGYGGIFAPVAIWRRRRKILVPAFSPKIVENFVEIFSEQSQKLVNRLDERASRDNFSVWPYLTSYTLDTVCESAMGVKINAQGDPKTPFLVSMQIMLNLVCKRIFKLWLQPDWLFKLFPEYSEHQNSVQTLHEFTDEVIHRKRQELKEEKNPQAKEDTGFDLSNYKRLSFLDLLISISGGEKGYTNEELREEVLTLAVAGTDTSAVCIGYTLKLLAKYPKVQQKVFEEISEVFGDSDRQLVKEDLLKLKYLDRVVKESLRLFPPVPFVIRKILEDTTLPSGSVLPAGSGIAVSIWGLHRDPKYWGPDSECFDPDRFLPERFNLQYPCSYMPFSNGPRNCIGYQYALMSIKTTVSAIVRRFKIVGDEESGPIPHIKCKIDIMMKDVDEYKIGLENRSMTKNSI